MTSDPTPPRWQHLDQQIDHLLDLPEAQREKYLAETERSSPADARLLRQWMANIDRAAAEPLTETHDGQRIGPWRALKRLGRGGMGEVWLGERADGAYAKQVAVKFLHGDDVRLRERLFAERDLLAQLQHSNIARLIDGGQTPDGQPYLVTEFVDGVSIDRWCRERRPDFARRLAVFRQVCAAVSHAHDQLVVHRDIKPSNVLVDGDDRAYLLDFGIARSISLSDETATMHALTPDYAAPEQVAGGPIGVRTDVYALGALWYFLICETPPLDLGGLSLAASVKRICDDEPVPPSSTGLHVDVSAALAADLDAITLKALSKSPQGRYTTADRLLADIDNALAHRPLEAQRSGKRFDRARRFVRRNRLAVSAATAIALSLLGGSGIALWQARNAATQAGIAQAERNRAQTEEQRAESTLDFIVAALGSGSSTGAPTDAKDLVELARKRALENTAAGPIQREALIDFVHDVYARRNEWVDLKGFLLQLLTEHRQEFDDDTVAALGCKLADLRILLGEKDEARQGIDQSAALISADTRRPDIRALCLSADVNWHLAVGDIGTALDQSRRLVEAVNEQGQRTDSFAARFLADYGSLLDMHNQQREARAQLLAAQAIYDRTERGRSIDAIEIRVRLASINNHIGLSAEALKEIDQGIDDALAALGPTWNVARYLSLKAQYLVDARQPQVALDALERSRAMLANSTPEEVAQLAPHLAIQTGRAYAALGQAEKAEQAFARVDGLFEQAGTPFGGQYRSLAQLFRAEAAIPSSADETAARAATARLATIEEENRGQETLVGKRFYPRLRLDQAQAALYAGDLDLAERTARDARALYLPFSAPDGWQLATCDAILARIKLIRGDDAAGRAGLQDAIARMKTSLGPENPRIAELQAALVATESRSN